MDLLQTSIKQEFDEKTDNVAFVLPNGESQLKEECDLIEIVKDEFCKQEVESLVLPENDNPFSKMSNITYVSNNEESDGAVLLPTLGNEIGPHLIPELILQVGSSYNPSLLPGILSTPEPAVDQNSEVPVYILGLPAHEGFDISSNKTEINKGIQIRDVSTLVDQAKFNEPGTVGISTVVDQTKFNEPVTVGLSPLVYQAKFNEPDTDCRIKVDRVMTLPVQHFVNMSHSNFLKSKLNLISDTTNTRNKNTAESACLESDSPNAKKKKSSENASLELMWLHQNSKNRKHHDKSVNMPSRDKSDPAQNKGLDDNDTNRKRPSKKIRSSMGQFVFSDGAGYYYRQDTIIGSKRFLKCVHEEKCRALGEMEIEDGSPIYQLGPPHVHKPFLVRSHENFNELYEQLKLYSGNIYLKTSNKVKTINDKEGTENIAQSVKSDTFNEDSGTLSSDEVDDSVFYENPVLWAQSLINNKGTFESTSKADIEDLSTENLESKTLKDFSQRLQTTKGIPEEFYAGTVSDNDGHIQAAVFLDKSILARLGDNLKTEIKNFVMDNTFRVLPSNTVGLKQLFSLHVIIRNASLPLLYAIMTNTEKQVYVGILKGFQRIVPDWPVMSVLVDNHKPLKEAIAEVYPGAKCYGCWYHYCYSIWKVVMNNGLVEECKSSQLSLLVIRMLMVLPQLPPSAEKSLLTMYEGLESIKGFVKEHNLPSALNNVISHVENLWMSKLKPENFTLNQVPRRAPVFIESFHLSLLSFMKLEGDIWSFTDALRCLAKDVSSEVHSVITGKAALKKRIKSQRFNVLIKESYHHLLSGNYTMDMFLKRISISVGDIMDIFLHPLQPVIGDNEDEDLFDGWDMAVIES